MTDDEPSEIEAAEVSLGEEEEEETPTPSSPRPVSADDPLAFDMFEAIATEMELERQRFTPHQSSSRSPLKQKGKQKGKAKEMTETWEVKDRSTPRAIAGPSSSNGFNWRARQHDAVQVDWDTQDPTPRVARRTPPPTRAWGAQRMSIKDQISPRRSVPRRSEVVDLLSDGENEMTPKAELRPARELIRRSIPAIRPEEASRSPSIDVHVQHRSSSVHRPHEEEEVSLQDDESESDPLADLLPEEEEEDVDVSNTGQREEVRSDDLKTPTDSQADLPPTPASVSQYANKFKNALELDMEVEEDEQDNDDLDDERAVDMEMYEAEDEDPLADLLPPEEDSEVGDDGTGTIPDDAKMEEEDPLNSLLPPEEDEGVVDLDVASGEEDEASAKMRLPPIQNGAVVRPGSSHQPINRKSTQPFRNIGDVEQPEAGPSKPKARPLKAVHDDIYDYAAIDSGEEEDDRALLRQRAISIQGSVDEPPPGQGRYRTESIAPSITHVNGHAARVHEVYRGSSRARSAFTDDGVDAYLVDDNGQELETDPEFVIPRDHKDQPSRIHGRVGNQASSYSRASGRRKWTKSEELLLYRTVQQVPLSEEYPLRVVWYLHGEYGVLSRDLAMFNPQHMKDKMRVIVAGRVHNRKDVVLRARFWLPREHYGREEYEREVSEWKREVSKVLTEEGERLDEEKRIREEEERKERERQEAEEEGSEDEDEDEQNDEDEEEEDDDGGNEEDAGSRKAKKKEKGAGRGKGKGGGKSKAPEKTNTKSKKGQASKPSEKGKRKRPSPTAKGKMTKVVKRKAHDEDEEEEEDDNEEESDMGGSKSVKKNGNSADAVADSAESEEDDRATVSDS
jgi:hypothetical protein